MGASSESLSELPPQTSSSLSPTLVNQQQWLSVGTTACGRIAIGISAHGFVAIGICAHGVVSIGVIAMGVFSAGLVSMGLVSTGLVVMGLTSFGPMQTEQVQPHHQSLQGISTRQPQGSDHLHSHH